jgi:hypothetical protein
MPQDSGIAIRARSDSEGNEQVQNSRRCLNDPIDAPTVRGVNAARSACSGRRSAGADISKNRMSCLLQPATEAGGVVTQVG